VPPPYTNKISDEISDETNNIGDAGAAAISDALRPNGGLAKLDLRSNTIGNRGLGALMHRRRPPRQPRPDTVLTQLELEMNDMTDLQVRRRSVATSPRGCGLSIWCCFGASTRVQLRGP
jgi:hypothetical protein